MARRIAGFGARPGREPVVGVGRGVREAHVEDDQLRPVLLPLHDPLGVGVEVVPGLEVRADEQNDVGVGVVGTRAVVAHPPLVAGAPPRRADVRVRVVAVHVPGGQDALGVAVLPGPAHVVHHLVVALLGDRLADARRDVVEGLVPGHALPAVLAALAGALQGEEDAVGVFHLVEGRRPLGAASPARARVLGVALELLHLERLAIDVGEQPARRLAVEAGGRDEHEVPLDALRPRARVELDPVVPALLRRVGGELGPARPGVEGLAPPLGGALRGGDAVDLVVGHGVAPQARGTAWPACTNACS